MKKFSNNSVSVIETEKEVYILFHENKNHNDYREISIPLWLYFEHYGIKPELIEQTKKLGFIPRKEMIYITWIHKSIYDSLKEAGGIVPIQPPTLNY
jgi:hypothetical protein